MLQESSVVGGWQWSYIMALLVRMEGQDKQKCLDETTDKDSWLTEGMKGKWSWCNIIIAAPMTQIRVPMAETKWVKSVRKLVLHLLTLR